MGLSGQLTPIVFVPKFTSYVGTGNYRTSPIDVSAYSGGTFVAWRGPLVGDPATHPGLFVVIQDSEDENNWFDLAHADLDAVELDTVDITLTRRWLRCNVQLHNDTGTDPAAVTCWCVGSLERRV